MSSLLLPLLLLGTAAVVVGVKHHRSQLPAQVVNAPQRLPSGDAESSISPGPAPLYARPVATDIAYRTPWEALERENLRGFVQVLRAGGCPEETIQDFSVAVLGRRHQARVEAPMRQRVQQSTWWREPVPGGLRDDLARAIRQGREALDRELFELLGIPGEELRRQMGWDIATPERQWLTQEKRTVLIRLEQQHTAELADLEAQALPGGTGPILTDDLRAQLRALRTRQREELGVALGAADFEHYLVRESAEARYVLRNLPQAKDAEEFRRWVQAAIDVGVEQVDVTADQLSRHVPHQAMGTEPPRLRERVVARFRELSDPERVAVLEAEMAAEQQRETEARAREREMSQLEHLRETAMEGGVSISLEEARQFAEALDRHSQELGRQWGPMPTDLSDADRAVWEARIQVEFEKVAVSVLGDRGRVLTETMARQQKRSR
jgi:hypothetical protein